MKKFITMALTLLMVLSASSANIFAEDSPVTNNDGNGSYDINVSSSESVTQDVATGTNVCKVTIAWTTEGATYSRKDTYTWDTTSLNYILKDENKGTASVTPATTTITITNYSNTAVDYDITFASAKTGTGDDAKTIASETADSDSAAKTGTLASADQAGAIQQTVTNTTKQAVYKGSISYANDYAPENGNNTAMGTYTVVISKALTLNETTLSLKEGKTATLTANQTVTWTSDNTSVATVSDGAVEAIGAGTATITATATNGKTATCTVTVTSKPTSYDYDYASDNSTFSTLLASSTVDFTYDSKTYTAYNGFISETAYANWQNAQEFVAALNTANIAPAGKTNGTWILFGEDSTTGQVMAQAWADATSGEESGFAGVYNLWSSVEVGNNAYDFCCCDGSWNYSDKSFSNAYFGFVVLWAQN